MAKIFDFILIILFLLVITNKISAQDQKEKSLNVSCDIVSSYVWRGGLVDLNPNIQPTLSFNKGGFEVGAWGSTNFIGNYKEVDLYLQYTFKGFTAGVYDYYWPADWPEKNYFNYKSDNTSHIYEGFINYNGPENFPISVLVSTWFYGDDKYSDIEYPDDSTKWGDQRYSTYFELLYPFTIGENNLDLFAGATPMENVYGTGPGIVNLGITGSRNIKITDAFELPVKAQLIVNPQSEQIFMVFGITL